jgi:hypothetical protein
VTLSEQVKRVASGRREGERERERERFYRGEKEGEEVIDGREVEEKF